MCRWCVEVPILLAQQVLLHLAHGVARQVVDEDDTLRQLELGEPLSSAFRTSASRRAPTFRLGTTTAVTPSPKSGCGTPITARLDHAGDGVDLALDLLRIDVVAAGDDQVLAAADDVDVAALVDLAEVAGDEEAVRRGTRPRSSPACASSP